MCMISLKTKVLEFKEFSGFLLKDARHFQIFYLSLFLIYGISFLHWDADISRYTYLLVGTGVFQLIFCLIYKKSFSSLKSALISALGLCLLLKTNEMWVALLAAFIAVSSKFLIRFDGKHLFNPANLAIIATVLLTGEAWVSVGQWGTNTVQVYFFIGAALLVLLKVGRVDTSLGFLITFAGLEFIRSVLYLNWEFDHYIHYLSNGTLLLFTFFMITDPVTTPNHPKARVFWSVLIGVLSFILTRWLQLYSAPIWALIIVAPFTPLFDKLWQARKFSWHAQINIPHKNLNISKS